jgi:DNA-binding NarL/FixJ family response regulator
VETEWTIDPIGSARQRDDDQRVIRIGILDDHPAVLAGLERLVGTAPDLAAVVTADTPKALWRELDRSSADVIVVDYDLARGDGLAVCQRLKERPRPPRVVMYSAYAGPALAVAARIAHADALVNKSAPVDELLAAIRRVTSGETVLPPVDHELHDAAMSRLDERDIAVAAMLLSGASQQGIAATLGIERREVASKARRIIARLRPHRASPARSHRNGGVASSDAESRSRTKRDPLASVEKWTA